MNPESLNILVSLMSFDVYVDILKWIWLRMGLIDKFLNISG